MPTNLSSTPRKTYRAPETGARYDMIATFNLAQISSGGVATDERLHISDGAVRHGFKTPEAARAGFIRWARRLGYPEEVALSPTGKYYRIVGRNR